MIRWWMRKDVGWLVVKLFALGFMQCFNIGLLSLSMSDPKYMCCYFSKILFQTNGERKLANNDEHQLI